MSLLASAGTVDQEEGIATMVSPMLSSDGPSLSRIGVRVTMEETVEAHDSPSQHPDFFSLPHPSQDTRPPSLVTSALLQEPPRYHSESKPSPEQYRDLMHPAVAIPRAHGHGAAVKHWQPPAMPGMWFLPPYPGYYALPTMHPVEMPLLGHAMNLQHPLLTGMWFPSHYPGHYPAPTSTMPLSQNVYSLEGKRVAATLHDPKRPAENIPTSKKTKKAKAVTPHQEGPIDAAKHNRLRGVTVRPSSRWQVQVYYAGQSRYIGLFDAREQAALAYKIARDELKPWTLQRPYDAETVKAAVKSARKAAFAAVVPTRPIKVPRQPSPKQNTEASPTLDDKA